METLRSPIFVWPLLATLSTDASESLSFASFVTASVAIRNVKVHLQTSRLMAYLDSKTVLIEIIKTFIIRLSRFIPLTPPTVEPV